MDKSTGIIRRIDDLGRIVSPKEIRRKLKIRENDPLEFFYTEDQTGLVIRKYHPVSSQDFKRYASILRAAAKKNNVAIRFYIVDRDGINILSYEELPENIKSFAEEAARSNARTFNNVSSESRIAAFRLSIDDDLIAAILIESANDEKSVAAVDMMGAMVVSMFENENAV